MIVQSTWLFEDHSNKWLDFNLLKAGISTLAFEGVIPYATSTIARYRTNQNADVKLGAKEEFYWHCTIGFKKSAEIAFNPFLLNLDYSNDLLKLKNNPLLRTNNISEHLLKHKIDLNTFLDNDEDAKVISEFSKTFLKLNWFKCNLLYQFFDVYFYDIDYGDFGVLNDFSMLNTDGRKQFRTTLSKTRNIIPKDDITLKKIISFSEMKNNIQIIKILYRKAQKKFKMDLAKEKPDQHSEKYKNRSLSKEFMLGQILLKFISSDGSATSIQQREMKIFTECLVRYITMDIMDWELLIKLNMISMKDKNDIRDSIYSLTSQKQNLRKRAVF